ncbi:MAG: phage terminase large subunit family protein [Deltaproteobacteria bacterium]|nr:phage terminase large subunit family protein [Deltaproteobacteria bacterium]
MITVPLGDFWGLEPAERDMLVPAARPTLPDWAEEAVYLPKGVTDFPGFFSFDYAPYLRGPAEALTDNFTREVWLQSPTQAGKSFLSYLLFAYTLVVRALNFLLVLPDEPTAKKRMRRLRRLCKANPDLLAVLGGQPETLNIGEPTSLERMEVIIAWAHSASALADVSTPIICADEVGKYPASVGKESDPISLFRHRQERLSSISKLLAGSTAVWVGDLFDREFRSGQLFEYHLICPYCDRFFLPDNDNMILGKDGQGEFLPPERYEADRENKLAWFECSLCHERYTDADRALATQGGRWVPRGAEIAADGTLSREPPPAVRKSFHIHMWAIHPQFQPIWRLAAGWVRAIAALRIGNRLPLQDYRNSVQGLPWEIKAKVPKASELAQNVGDYAEGTLPWGVQFVTAAVDVQLDHVWVMVKGWGYGAETWLIVYTRVNTGDTSILQNWRPVEQFLSRAWPSAGAGQPDQPICLAGIDCGYHKETVQDFVRMTDLPAIAVRGEDSVTKRTYNVVHEKETGATRFDLNTNALKDRVYHAYYETDPGPGYGHLPHGTTEEVFEQLASEEKKFVRKGMREIAVWVKKGPHVANHALDCDVYATAAAEIAGLWQLDRMPEAPAGDKSQKSDIRPARPGFLDRLPNLQS